MAAPTEYTVTVWNTGDVITAVKLDNLETQYDKAVTIPNNTFYQGKDGAGVPMALIGVNVTDDVQVGSNVAAQDDLQLLSRLDIIIKPSGTATETGRFVNDGVLKMLQNIEVEKASPQIVLNRTSGQFTEIQIEQSGSRKVNIGYDHTNLDFEIRVPPSATPVFKINLATGFVETFEQPQCQAKKTDSDFTTTNNSEVSIPLNAEDYDNDSMHSVSASTNLVTVNMPGIYAVSARLRWANRVGASDYREMRVYAGSEIVCGDTDYGDRDTLATASAIVKMVAATAFSIAVFTDTGSDETIPNNTVFLTVRRLGNS